MRFSRLSPSRAGLPILILIAGLFCTALAVIQLRSLVREAEQARFAAITEERAGAVSDRIDTYVALLRGMAGFFAASGEVTAGEFKSYFDRLRLTELYPGVQGMGYIARVPLAERDVFAARVRTSIDSDFRIWPEGDRDFYAPIVFLLPEDQRNHSAIGFDMATEPNRLAAMQQATETTIRATTAKVMLGERTNQNPQPGFQIFVPLYATPNGAVPATVEERRATASGWIYSPFRAPELFAKAFELRGRESEIDYAVYDGPSVDEEKLLYRSSTQGAPDADYSATKTLDAAGRQWTIVMRNTDFFVRDSNRAIIPFIAAGGLLTTFILFAAGWAQASATQAAEKAQEQLHELNLSLEDRVEERTAQLETAHGALESLNRNLETIVAVRTADLQEANQEIQRFAYIVSHDLRSPLVNVMGFTSELDIARTEIAKFYSEAVAKNPELENKDAKSAIEVDLPESIEFIRSSTAKMDRLINAILRLSREGRRVLSPEPLKMNELLHTISRSIQHQTAEVGATVEIGELPEIVSDRLAVEQVFSNLIENAVKYLAPDRPGQIRVRGGVEGGMVAITVEDNGRGIAPADHSRIFDLFRRAGTQDRPGEGIGLAHVRALVRRLGGNITVKSTLGEGSTFRVTLPKTLKATTEGTA